MGIFGTTRTPRVFALPPGCNFAEELVAGLMEKFSSRPPEEMARVELYLNAGRVRKGVVEAFSVRGAFLLPKLQLITNLSKDVRFFRIEPQVSGLRRRLELFRAVSKLLEKDDRFAAQSSAYDLADSLATLMDEMHAEGVSPERIGELDVSQHSAHWAESLKFIDIISQFWRREDAPDNQARQRMVVETLVESWKRSPPSHPIIVAGSTGSRGATRLLMQAVAALPNGAVILPCFDFQLPGTYWQGKADSTTGEDHPQFRFKRFLEFIRCRPNQVKLWREDAQTIPERNQLISLALRPAPVTGQWLTEGPRLTGIAAATKNLTLIEAPHARAEAVAIACRLRQAAESGEKAALVTPDIRLAKQVKAALERWNIQPEDSFNVRLAETLPGRLLLLIASLFGSDPDPLSLISLTRHPLVHSKSHRKEHCVRIDKLERDVRRNLMDADLGRQINRVFPTNKSNDGLPDWCKWLMDNLVQLKSTDNVCLSLFAKIHQEVAESLIIGSKLKNDTKDLWNTFGGSQALALLQELQREGASGGVLDRAAYTHLFSSMAYRKSVQKTDKLNHPNISIWNTVDARMQAPDVVIAGGLNEGVWPNASPVDPWLNRALRGDAGLLMPERLTGLLAHDFQQAVSAPVVVLSRSERRKDEPAVPSRWLIRLTTLLAGIGDHGKVSLAAMRQRGQQLLDLAMQMEEPLEPKKRESRPCPKPPVEQRPKRLSVTNIKTLISNPYEIYARYVLKLNELDPLVPNSYAAVRGTAIHEILQKFVDLVQKDESNCNADNLLAIADSIFAKMPGPPHLKRLWLAQLEIIALKFASEEANRAMAGTPVALEVKGEHLIKEIDFVLSAIVDRVDRLRTGGLAVYDYKSGSIPSLSEVNRRDKQLPLTTKMLNFGAFPNVQETTVMRAAYIGVGKYPQVRTVPMDTFEETWKSFIEMIRSYQNPETGYLSRLNMYQLRYGAAFDHLARYGEWDEAVLPTGVRTSE